MSITLTHFAPPGETPLSPVAARRTPPGEPDYELIELFFFAYRDFVGDPDRILAEFGLGRAHHRVLHFVTRQPGLTIADLLDTLRITKQSLNRVLKELIAAGLVQVETGPTDRRQRLLAPTESGAALARRLFRVQDERLSRALAQAGPGTRAEVVRFLSAVVGPAPSEPE